MAEADAEHRHVGGDERLRVVDRVGRAAPDRRGRCSGTRRRDWSRAARPPASSPDRRARRSRARSAGAGCSTSSRSRRRRSSAAASAGARARRRTRPDPPPASRTPSADVTPRTRSEPSIFGIARARSTSACGSSCAAGRDHAAHHAARPQLPRQRARVDVGDGDDAGWRRGSRAASSPTRQLLATGDSSRMMKPATCGARDSTSSRRHAVVADLGAGHRDDLSGVGRIGEHFLIAGHARVEHDLAAALRPSRRRPRRGTRCRLRVRESLPCAPVVLPRRPQESQRI